LRLVMRGWRIALPSLRPRVCTVMRVAGLQTRGLKEGRAIVVVTYANVVALIVAVLFGVLALSEPLPKVRACLLARVFVWLATLLPGCLARWRPRLLAG
jgi:lysylphosphatidylglycerol synthetase-like protein (DUF2156 family)